MTLTELALKNGTRVAFDRLGMFTVANSRGVNIARFEVTDSELKILWIEPTIGLGELADWVATLHPGLRHYVGRSVTRSVTFERWVCPDCRFNSDNIFDLVGRPCDPPS